MNSEYANADVCVLRRKVLTLAGAKFHIYDREGRVLLFSKLKAFKLKEDIRVYTGEDMQAEALRIAARKILDFSSAYDVFDGPTGQKLGALRRKGMKSLIRDEWIIMDANDQPIGLIQEDNAALALVRRFVEAASMFLPQAYNVTVGGAAVATFKQNFNPFVQKLTLDYTADVSKRLDRRLGIAAAVVIGAIEGRQG